MSTKPVLVVGGGIAGLATAWALARRGIAVELFEQGGLPHARGSSYDEHRIIRHAYGEMDGYARLMPAAFAAWQALWADLGATHYAATGAVYFLRDQGGWYDATTRSLDALGIGHRDLPLAGLAQRFPMIRAEGVRRVLETDGAGMLFPIRILHGLVGLLPRMGVRLRPGCAVTAIDPQAGTVVADGVTRSGQAVVVAAGAWVDRLVPALKGVAVPSRQAALFLAPPDDLAKAWAEAPVLLNRGADSGTYTLPPRDGTRLKIGDHRFSRRGNPDEDRVATEADLARLRLAAAAGFRDLHRYTELERRACFYTVTEDERFIVRALGPRGWVVSACSGHGFKLGALMGQGVAQAIVGERSAEGLPAWAAGEAA